MIGRILRVACKNFVTYNDCEFFPSDSLNIVIGPNGTGKSTLISAIVLCLGGEPKLLSRATSIEHYIQNGFLDSTVVVDICKNGDNPQQKLSLERHFDRNGKSVYKIDGRVVTKTEYIKTIAKYNIQINNLCQFLPQDRVQDFAKMNPQDLFANTISSVCSQDKVETYNKLKELQKSYETGEKSIEQIKDKLKIALARKNDLEKILENDKERQSMENKIKICKAKNKWLEYKNTKTKVEDIEKNLSPVKKELNEKKKTLQNILKQQQPLQQKLSELELDCKKQNNLQTKMQNEYKEIKQLTKQEINNIEEEKIKEERRKRELRERETEIENQSKLLSVLSDDLQNAVESIGSEADLKLERNKIEKEIHDTNQLMINFMKKRQDITRKLDEEHLVEYQVVQKRIEKFNNHRDQKLKFLMEKFSDTYAALEWLNNHRNLFSGKIYGPLMLEMNIPDTNNVSYIENSIPLRDLTSFACENESDVSLFTNEVCVKKKLRINVGHAPKNSGIKYLPKIPIEELRRIGFKNYLVDLIEAPQPILDYFCMLYNIHQIPVGNDDLKEDDVPNTLHIFFKGDIKFNIVISRYCGEPSIMTSRIKNKMILTSANPKELQSLMERAKKIQLLKDECRNQRTTIEVNFNELDFKRKDLIAQKKIIESKSNRLRELQLNYQMKQDKVNKLKKNLLIETNANEIDIKTKLKQKFEILNNQYLVKCAKAFDGFLNASKEKLIKEARGRIFKKDTEKLELALEEAKNDVTEVQERCDKLSKDLENAKHDCKLKLNSAKILTENQYPHDSNFLYKNEFEKLPENLKEISDQITEYQACLECMDTINPSVQKEYNERIKEIVSLNINLKENVDQDAENSRNIKELFEEWYPQIDTIIQDINYNFGKFMQNMGYVGETVLSKKNEFDFESYGILLYVQYRKNVKLQPLDRNVQSGGERAIAIAAYSLSLQHLTNVPFRCVDEINQGMDSRNERKLFEMLLEEITEHSQSQYFFVTPKLLPNLKSAKKQTFSIIYNGKVNY